MILFICIFTDIGGYTFGKFFKGPKLTKISPKKTYSGVVGGYLFSIIFLDTCEAIYIGAFRFVRSIFDISFLFISL